MIRHAYGCRPDTADQRDHPFLPKAIRLPAHVDLTAHMPPVMDQGDLGSCTAHGILAAFRYDLISQAKPDLELSRLMLYYEERALEHTIKSDAGAEIRDGLKALTKVGVCPESLWPYDVKKFATAAPKTAYACAKQHEALSYQRVTPSLSAIRGALAGGLPVIIGCTLYDSFESDAVARTGLVPMPKRNEAVAGGHCMIVTGYDDASQRFRVRNSWSKDWGKAGDALMPYPYLTNTDLTSDLWIVSSVTS